MPLEPPDQKFFEAACGYAQLGMFLDANEELEEVHPYRNTQASGRFQRAVAITVCDFEQNKCRHAVKRDGFSTG